MIVHPMSRHGAPKVRGSILPNKSSVHILRETVEEETTTQSEDTIVNTCGEGFKLDKEALESRKMGTATAVRPTKNSLKLSAENNLRHFILDNATPERPQLTGDGHDVAAHFHGCDDQRRRTIFTKFWHREENGIGSNKVLPSVDILEFSPPQHHRSPLCKHFSPVDGFLTDIASPVNMALPTVPSPLRRHCGDQGGVYPLVRPASILRTSRFLSANEEEHLASCQRSPSFVESCSSISREKAEHTPIEPGSEPKAIMIRQRTDTETTSSDSLNETESHVQGHVVRFDPRVTITEFEETSGQKWFTDEELDSFKHEALVLAHRHMRLNPQVAKAFTEGRRDPITGKVRQRAMFTNPALSANSDVSLSDLHDSDTMKDLIASEIRRILIVDPNEVIRELFSVSLTSMFPQANVSAVHTGEDAWREIDSGVSRCDKFDVIIVEERLGWRQQLRTVLPVLIEMKSTGSESNMLDAQATSTEEKSMSGSDLLRMASEMQQEGTDSECSRTTSRSALSLAPLLIGVSMHLDQDRAKMLASGADMIWGKPPPRAGRNLRNEIFRKLLHKRHRLSALAGFPIDPS